MRISDWSSDVCSSDLINSDAVPASKVEGTALGRIPSKLDDSVTRRDSLGKDDHIAGQVVAVFDLGNAEVGPHKYLALTHQTFPASVFNSSRSEEHTSELQSLMRISYAVFCLNTTTNSFSTTYKQ